MVPLPCTAIHVLKKKKKAPHAQAQAQGDWREDGAYRQREEETAAPFFWGFGGA
jgi:hypothetical protein